MKLKALTKSLSLLALASAGFSLGCRESLAQNHSIESTVRLMQDGDAECHRKFPNLIKQAIARAMCENKNLELLRPTAPYPDLIDLELTNNLVLAEKIQRGKMTLIERDAAAAQFHSKIITEMQRRVAISSAGRAASQPLQPNSPDIDPPPRYDPPRLQNNLPQTTRCQSTRMGNSVQTVCN
jgi:hypothetical protein